MMNHSDGASVTDWIRKAKARAPDPDAEQAIWNHYFSRVVKLAGSRMFGLEAAVYDAEDAAVSALNSFFRGLREDRYPELNHRHNLWRILILITKRKVMARRRKDSAAARRPDGQVIRTEQIAQIISQDPTPDFVAEMMDEVEHLLEILGDEQLRRIALMRMEGLTYDEIADRLHCAARTVSRKIDRIRDIWGTPEQD